MPFPGTLIQWIKSAIGDIMVHASETVQPIDKIRITFACGSFREKGPGSLMEASTVNIEDVSHHRKNNYNIFDEECARRQGIKPMNNKDNFCLPRAIMVAIALAEKNPEYTKMRRDIGKIQLR
ncbi:hypothetical protein JTB14_021192 [Gonioctena quinquepunctata]|nr:hypothetical protein JTB14_021192 [Gonioctena quinquepunctata]